MNKAERTMVSVLIAQFRELGGDSKEADLLERTLERHQQTVKQRKARETLRHDDWFSEDVGRRAVLNRAAGRCERIHDPGQRCPQRLAHIHHLRGRGVDDPWNPENLIGLCEYDHAWAHANPAAALEAGLMRSRLAVKR